MKEHSVPLIQGYFKIKETPGQAGPDLTLLTAKTVSSDSYGNNPCLHFGEISLLDLEVCNI